MNNKVTIKPRKFNPAARPGYKVYKFDGPDGPAVSFEFDNSDVIFRIFSDGSFGFEAKKYYYYSNKDEVRFLEIVMEEL